jgi:dihydroneopterin aldolase
MRFHALVGVLPHEQVYPQPLEIDVTVWRSARPGEAAASASDDAVIDYRELYDAVAARVAVGPLRFLEDIARTLVGDLLTRRHVRRVRVAVRKPQVPLGGPVAYAEVIVDSGPGSADA